MLEQEGLSEYISDTWNQQDLLFSLIAGLICALRLWYSAPGAERAPAPDVTGAPMHTLAALPVDLYAILVVMNFYRVLRYLSYYRSVGVLTLVVNFMLVDVGVFATLLFLITVGFGFAFVVLLPTDEADDTPWRIMGSHPVWSTWWGLFEDYDRLGMYRAVGEQMPTAIVAPSMLWICNPPPTELRAVPRKCPAPCLVVACSTSLSLARSLRVFSRALLLACCAVR